MQHEKDENLVIDIDEFFKTTLKIGVIKESKPVPRSSKLYELLVEIGEETRTILSGLAGSYTVEELVGKQVVVVTNLKPVKLCGIQSNGMILAASDKSGGGDKAVLLRPEQIVPSGSEID
ncbi:MAG: methionine--tRNA ligase subunit beta [Firmicutes bacterium]|nr:methionine--tRNA ligase subunit beta [Bacillota bacterium]